MSENLPVPQPSVAHDEHHKRGDMALIGRALRERWAIPPHIYALIPNTIARMLEEAQSDRERAAAVALFLSMNKQNLDADVEQDRIARLDAGSPTEVVYKIGKIEL
jgi:HD-like signal output (HDOD) protein